MRAYELVKLTTHRGASTVTLIVQDEGDWVDATNGQDIVLVYQVLEVTSTPTLTIQTGPSKDDGLFTAVTGMSALTMSASTTPVVKTCLLVSNPAVPLARWVRFVLNGPGALFDVTWRAYILIN